MKVIPERMSPTIENNRFSVFAILLIFLIGFAGGSVRAEEVPINEPNEPWRVFVPTDSEGQELPNSYYWIPEELYRQLNELVQSQSLASQPWSILQARYTGGINESNWTDTVSLIYLKATYRIYLKGSQATILFPTNSYLTDGSVRFDKQPIVPLYREAIRSEQHSDTTGENIANSGGGYVLEIVNSAPGEHLLEFTFSLPPLTMGQAITIPIPPIPDAMLELTIPPDSPPLEIPGALGEMTKTGNQLTVALGAIDHLTFRYLQEVGSGQSLIDVEQFFRLHARANQTDLLARFVFRISGKKVKNLYLQDDPRYLFLGQCTCNEAEIESITPDENNNELLKVTFKEPVAGTVTLNTSYIAQNFAGIGQLRPPRIRAANARIVRNQLALTKAPNIEFNSLPPSDLSLAIFRTQWPDTDSTTPTLAAYDLLKINPELLFSIQTKKEPIVVNEQLAIAFKAKDVALDYRGELPDLKNLLRCTLIVPDLFSHETLSLLDEKGNPVDPPAHYHAGRQLLLFFRAPLNGRYTICLTGKSRSILDKSLELPIITLESAKKESQRIRLFRDSSVYLDFEPAVVQTTRPPSPDERNPFASMLPIPLFIGDYNPLLGYSTESSTAQSSPLHFVVRRNFPLLTGQTRQVLFQQQNQKWELGVCFDLNITDGEIDFLEIQLDELCENPVLVEPANQWQVIPGRNKQTLYLKSMVPLRNKTTFHLYIPLNINSETLRFPTVSIRSHESASSVGGESQPQRGIKIPTQSETVSALTFSRESNTGYWPIAPLSHRTPNAVRVNLEERILLPQREQNSIRPLNWETQGLETIPIDDTGDATMKEGWDETFLTGITRVSGMSRNDFQPLRVMSSRFSASLRPTYQNQSVILADYSLNLRVDGSLFGVALFDIRPAGQSLCSLKIPSQYEILDLTIDGISHSTTIADNRQLTLSLVPTRYCQTVILTFRTTGKEPVNISSSPGLYRMPFPAVDETPVERTFWTCAIEYDSTKSFDTAAACRVAMSRSEKNSTPFESTELLEGVNREPVIQSTVHWRTPIQSNDSAPILLFFDQERMKHLLKIFDLSAPSLNTSKTDLARWYLRWLNRWWGTLNEIESLLPPSIDSGSISLRQEMAYDDFTQAKSREGEGNLSFDPGDSNLTADYSASLPLISVTKAGIIALSTEHETLLRREQLLTTYESYRSQKPQTLSIYGTSRINPAPNARFLFGTSNGGIDNLEIFIPPPATSWISRQLFVVATWLFITIVLLVFIRRLFKKRKN